MKRVVVIASSRSDGNTHKVVKKLSKYLDFELIDLANLNIKHFDYEHKNKNDDFLPTLKQLLKYEQILFATPIYWYAMSGILKVFFDRITDCLTIEKDLGRQLRGKTMSAISCSDTEYLIGGFFIPFKETANYLGMKFNSNLHTYLKDEKLDNKLKRFAQMHV